MCNNVGWKRVGSVRFCRPLVFMRLLETNNCRMHVKYMIGQLPRFDELLCGRPVRRITRLSRPLAVCLSRTGF